MKLKEGLRTGGPHQELEPGIYGMRVGRVAALSMLGHEKKVTVVFK
jgi:hypothetical protein